MDENEFQKLLDTYGLNFHKLTDLGFNLSDIKHNYKKHLRKYKREGSKEIKQINDVYYDKSYMCNAILKENGFMKTYKIPITNLKGNILICLKDYEYKLRGEMSLIEEILCKLDDGNGEIENNNENKECIKIDDGDKECIKIKDKNVDKLEMNEEDKECIKIKDQNVDEERKRLRINEEKDEIEEMLSLIEEDEQDQKLNNENKLEINEEDEKEEKNNDENKLEINEEDKKEEIIEIDEKDKSISADYDEQSKLINEEDKKVNLDEEEIKENINNAIKTLVPINDEKIPLSNENSIIVDQQNGIYKQIQKATFLDFKQSRINQAKISNAKKQIKDDDLDEQEKWWEFTETVEDS